MSTIQIVTPARALKIAAMKVSKLQGGPASVQQELHKQGILMSIEECRKALEDIKNA